MAAEPGGKLLYPSGAPRQTFVAKNTQMVFLSVMGNRVCAAVLSGIAGDGNQLDSGETAGSGDTDESCDGGRYAGGRRMG